MTLHIVNKNYPNSALLSCLQTASLDSALLLIENGVYNAVIGSAGAELITTKGTHLDICLLLPDLLARGLPGRLLSCCRTITDGQFVELVIQHEKSVTWC